MKYIVVSFTVTAESATLNGDACFKMQKGKSSMRQIREAIKRMVSADYPDFDWDVTEVSGIAIVDEADAEILYPDYFDNQKTSD